MTTITLTSSEKKLLQAGAANRGCLQLAATMKPANRARLLARFQRDDLITAAEVDDGQHRLTAAAYRALGLTPPKARRAFKAVPRQPNIPDRAGANRTLIAHEAGAAAVVLSKKAQVLKMLAREDGATLSELIAVTGWLPHTVRAALSRIRSGGQALAKAARPDASVAYRIPAALVAPRNRRAGVTPALTAQAADAVVASAL